MLGFIESIVDLIIRLGSYAITFIKSLISGIVYLAASAQYLIQVIQFLPPVLMLAAVGVVAIAIVHIFLLMK